MKLQIFYDWLDEHLNFEKTQTKNIFWLETMKFLCEKLGNPQNDIPCVHVAGSKGKGSVSVMIADILQAGGKKCGIYTSPHISDFRERICSAAGFFPDEIYEKSADQLVRCVDSLSPSELPGNRSVTWFELVTVFAFLCFKNAGCDAVVYETGLGGRLDSTNVVKPLVSVLMPIEKEHVEFLGDTIEKIAGEKAGIIKENTPSVVSFQKYEDAEKVFKKTAAEKKSEQFFVNDEIKNISVSWCSDYRMKADILFNDGKLYSPALKLSGYVQAQNAAAAITTVRRIFPEISDSQIVSGLEKAFLPGRFQIESKKDFTFILDGAHTPESMKNTINSVNSVFRDKKINLLFACAADKDCEDMISLFKNRFEKIILTKPGNVRASDLQRNENAFKANHLGYILEPDCSKAVIQAFTESEKNGCMLLVTGSFYLLAEAEKYLSN